MIPYAPSYHTGTFTFGGLKALKSIAFFAATLAEPVISIMDPDEYFIVGGVFSFDLYVVPLLTVRKEDITYFQSEY